MSVLGTTHAVSCAHVGVAEAIRRLWAPFALPPESGTTAGPVTYHRMSSGTLRVDGETVVRGASAVWLLANFAATLNARALAGYGDLAIHAAVVSRDGSVVAFPAVSGAGKSTLTAAACRAGFDYVSDEALCLRYADRAVEPYSKPLALSAWSARAVGLPTARTGLEENLYGFAELGARVPDGPLRLAHVVLPQRGHARAELVELDRTAALPELLRHSFNHHRRPADALALLAGAVSGARLWRLSYGDPVRAGRLLAARLR